MKFFLANKGGVSKELFNKKKKLNFAPPVLNGTAMHTPKCTHGKRASMRHREGERMRRWCVWWLGKLLLLLLPSYAWWQPGPGVNWDVSTIAAELHSCMWCVVVVVVCGKLYFLTMVTWPWLSCATTPHGGQRKMLPTSDRLCGTSRDRVQTGDRTGVRCASV